MKGGIKVAVLMWASCKANAFAPSFSGSPLSRTISRRSVTAPIMAIPLELEGQLDGTKSWEVELEMDGVTKKVTVPEGTSILEAAEMVYDDPPNSCRNGVCTTCAGLIQAGTEGVGGDFIIAVHALGQEQRDEGYTLTCQTYPCGPGLKVLLNQYDTVYGKQYGKFEVMEKKKSEPKKMFGIF
ncbi:unnamed protein product [Choristocarpus tenellus]